MSDDEQEQQDGDTAEENAADDRGHREQVAQEGRLHQTEEEESDDA